MLECSLCDSQCRFIDARYIQTNHKAIVYRNSHRPILQIIRWKWNNLDVQYVPRDSRSTKHIKCVHDYFMEYANRVPSTNFRAIKYDFRKFGSSNNKIYYIDCSRTFQRSKILWYLIVILCMCRANYYFESVKQQFKFSFRTNFRSV